MKANEFIKKYGLDEAIYFIKKYGGSKTTFKFFKVNENSVSVSVSVHSGDQPYDFHVDNLKRLIDSHELVDKCGGLIPCKKILVTRIRHKPNAEYFMVHLEKPNFIQLYRRNEAKLIPNYRFRDLEQAISDVESCQ